MLIVTSAKEVVIADINLPVSKITRCKSQCVELSVTCIFKCDFPVRFNFRWSVTVWLQIQSTHQMSNIYLCTKLFTAWFMNTDQQGDIGINAISRTCISVRTKYRKREHLKSWWDVEVVWECVRHKTEHQQHRPSPITLPSSIYSAKPVI